MKKKMKIITSRRKLLEARFNDLINTLYWDGRIKPKEYNKCLKKIGQMRDILKL